MAEPAGHISTRIAAPNAKDSVHRVRDPIKLRLLVWGLAPILLLTAVNLIELAALKFYDETNYSRGLSYTKNEICLRHCNFPSAACVQPWVLIINQ